MLVFRSLTVGLLGACVALLARVSVPRVMVIAPPAGAAATAPAGLPGVAPRPAVTIVDVAPQVEDVAALIHLAPGERVVAIDDRPVASTLAAGAALAATPRGPGAYVDLTVATDDGAASRRVLVLRH